MVGLNFGPQGRNSMTRPNLSCAPLQYVGGAVGPVSHSPAPAQVQRGKACALVQRGKACALTADSEGRSHRTSTRRTPLGRSQRGKVRVLLTSGSLADWDLAFPPNGYACGACIFIEQGFDEFEPFDCENGLDLQGSSNPGDLVYMCNFT